MDLIRYVLDRVAARTPLSVDVARAVEIEVRQCWGGDQTYISKGCDKMIAERNANILRDWRNGERVSLIARRYKLSRTHVWRIVRDVTSSP